MSKTTVDPPANQGGRVSSAPDRKLEDELFHGSTHPVDLLLGLKDLKDAGMFCDVILVASSSHRAAGQDEEDSAGIPCHRAVLGACVPYFRAMFSGSLREAQQRVVVINEVDESVLRMLVEYLYTAEINITQDNVQSLLSASNLLQILPVKDACCEFLLKYMTVENCIGIHGFAELYSCSDLQTATRSFILEQFEYVSREEEFLVLPQQKLIDFIKDDALHVTSEEQVYLAARRWLEGDWSERAPHFSQVLEWVRLPLVSPYFLHDCVLVDTALTSDPACGRLAEEARTFQLLPDRRAELQSHRTRHRASSGHTEVLVSVGGEDDKVVLRSVEHYHPVTKHWCPLACLPFAISKHSLVVTGGTQLYVLGGEYPDGSSSRATWRHDHTLSDCWHQMADLLMPRSELGVALLDGAMYAVGGWDGSRRLDTAERYDPPTNRWRCVAAMLMAVTSAAVAGLEGHLYVTGGAVLEDGDGIDLVQRYSPRADQWTRLSNMCIPRSGSAACVLGAHIYVIGGWHASTENTSKVERYCPRTDRWETRADLQERRYRPGAAVVDGALYVCGGEEGWDRYHDTIERYDADTDRWSVVGELPTPRSWHSCATMTVQRAVLDPGGSDL